MDISGYGTYRNWKSWSDEDFGTFSKEEAVYFRRELRAAGIQRLKGCKVLELGFGNGRFAAWSQSEGAAWTGIEMISELVGLARARQWDAYPANGEHDLPQKIDRFDIVIAFDVLEHLPPAEVINLLSRLKPMLAGSGCLVARVPSGDSPFSRAIQYGDVTHATPLGSSAIIQIAQSAGFQVMQIREPVLPIWGSGPVAALRRLLVIGSRRALYPLIRLVFMGTHRAILTPNMVFVLGIRQ